MAQKQIVVAGGSGFLGRRLSAHWRYAGARVSILSRNPEVARRRVAAGVDVARWNPPSVDDDLEGAIRGAAALVNLAGAPLGGRPWTPGHKHAILQSRLDSTRALVAAMRRLPSSERPQVLVNASGIDVYGDRPEGEVTEASAPGHTFLAGVVEAWEQAAREAEDLGVRVVVARTAMVVARDALAWRLVLLPFRLFVGGPLGSGRQRFTWIHVDDAVGIYDLAVRDDAVRGPVNLVAPEVPRQRELARAIGRAMHRPAIFPTPSVALRLALWGQADLVLHGRDARPAVVLGAGYGFIHPTVESALRDVLPSR
jgi:uncharacterized protein (TIGR01777 family)